MKKNGLVKLEIKAKKSFFGTMPNLKRFCKTDEFDVLNEAVIY